MMDDSFKVGVSSESDRLTVVKTLTLTLADTDCTY